MRKTTIAILATIVVLTIPLAAGAQITSAASGSWTDAATWTGGLLPTSADDVLIQAGHTISIDGDAAVCRDVSFGGEDALIDVNADGLLTVYGDFTLFSTGHTVFSAGWSATNAYIKFAGSAVQVLSGFRTDGGSTSFRDVIVDKDGGKLTTSGVGMRLGIQNSLEIINGLFELAPGDDLEGRWASSGNYRNDVLPNVVIRSNGEFSMLDGGGVHHIRSNYIDGGTPIGTFTVYGKATFIDASTYRISLNGVDIEDGGKVITSTGMGGGEFNCGPLHIKAGGELENYTTSDCYSATSGVTLDDGGLFDTKASTTIFPTTFVNNGTVRYSRDATTDQALVDMDYHNLEISLDPGNNKNWNLAGDRSISGSLKINYSANLVLTAGAAQSLTVGELLNLTSGVLDNSDTMVSLVMADGATVQRATGQIVLAPVFAGGVDVRYTSTSARVTTGPEVPMAAGTINGFEVSGDQGVDLAANITVGGACQMTGSSLYTGDFTVDLAPGANLVETAGLTVVGTVTATREVAQSVDEDFGEIGLELLAAGGAPGVTEVSRVTGMVVDKAGTESIARFFNVAPANNSGLAATVVFHYDEFELNGVDEGTLLLFVDNGSGWVQQSSVLDDAANTVTGFGLDSVAALTLASDGAVANMLQSVLAVPFLSHIDLSWRLTGIFAAGDFSVFRSEGDSGQRVALGNPVVADGYASFRFVDETAQPGTSYRYCVEVTDKTGTWTLFETEAVTLPVARLELGQNAPNPFNPMTVIQFSIPRTGQVSLDVLDIAGRRVVRLVDGVMAAGSHTELWTGTDASGQAVASGTYFYQVKTVDGRLIRKMMLVR